MDTSTNLGLDYILASQSDKHVTFNEAITDLDGLVQCSILSRSLAAPPAAPLEGDRYLVGPQPTGAWANREGQFAVFRTGGWLFKQPKNGWRMWIEDEEALLVWHNGGLRPTKSDLNPTPFIGVNTTANLTNRLAVASAGALFTHAGGDMRLVVNRNDNQATASIVLQSNYQGQAELGLAGDKNFRVKVADTTGQWRDGLVIDCQTGHASLPAQIPSAADGAILIANASRPIPASGLNFNSAQANLGIGTSSPAYSVHVNKTAASAATAAIGITGNSPSNIATDAHGVGLYLTYNVAQNRQFALLATDTKIGVRVVSSTYPALDGYNNGARTDLILGSETHGAHIAYKIGDSHFSVSNHAGNAAKTVMSIGGHVSQTGPLFVISKAHVGGAVGDVLYATASGKIGLAGQNAPLAELDVAGAIRPASYSVATLPTPASKGAGAIIFVSNEAGGPVLAFSDATNWRRVTDRAIVS